MNLRLLNLFIDQNVFKYIALLWCPLIRWLISRLIRFFYRYWILALVFFTRQFDRGSDCCVVVVLLTFDPATAHENWTSGSLTFMNWQGQPDPVPSGPCSFPLSYISLTFLLYSLCQSSKSNSFGCCLQSRLALVSHGKVKTIGHKLFFLSLLLIYIPTSNARITDESDQL